MADMKTRTSGRKSAHLRAPAPSAVRESFTVRDMNRQPQSLLTAAQTLGRVLIRSRSRGNFVLTPEAPASNTRVLEAEAYCQRLAEMRAQLRSMGFVPPSASDSEKIARMIAGEEP